MIHKLIFVAVVLTLFFTPVSGIASENQEGKANKKKIQTDGKCWKRISWIERTTPTGDGTRTPIYEGSGLAVCVDFEKVLNASCESPEKLKCNWTLPSGEKQFKKVQWQKLSFEEYKELIKELMLGKDHRKEQNKEWNKQRWNSFNADFKKSLEEGKLSIKMSVVDIDHDGRREHVIGNNWKMDCPVMASYAVIIPKNKQIDWRYKQLFLSPNSSDGAEIILYDGRAYIFGWEPIPGIVNIYKGFSLFGSTEFGSRNICQFKYLKGGKKR